MGRRQARDDGLTGVLEPEVEAHYDALYDGTKARMRPVGDALLAMAIDLGDDVEIGVTNLYVSMATPDGQFGLFFPASGRRVTLRLRLMGMVKPRGRFQSTADRAPEGRFDMRAYLGHVDHVDKDVRAMLRRARDLSAMRG